MFWISAVFGTNTYVGLSTRSYEQKRVVKGIRQQHEDIFRHAGHRSGMHVVIWDMQLQAL